MHVVAPFHYPPLVSQCIDTIECQHCFVLLIIACFVTKTLPSLISSNVALSQGCKGCTYRRPQQEAMLCTPISPHRTYTRIMSNNVHRKSARLNDQAICAMVYGRIFGPSEYLPLLKGPMATVVCLFPSYHPLFSRVGKVGHGRIRDLESNR